MKDISSADLSFLNLEAPLCISGSPIKKCGPNLRANPACIHAVSDAGFDVVGLANNHIMDYGTDGFDETICACRDAGLLTCGAAENLQKAQEPLYVKKKEGTIAIVAVAEREFSIAGEDTAGAAVLDPIDNLVSIYEAKKNADLVFVTIHGGNEYYPYPRPGLKKICRYFIEQGVDGVICHHAHVPGAYEIYKNKPIVYSLGNLIFDNPNPPFWWDHGYAIRLEYDMNAQLLNAYDIIPYTQSVEQKGVIKMSAVEKEQFMVKLETYRNTLFDEKKYNETWMRFCLDREKTLLLKVFFPFQFRGMGKLSRLFPIEKIFLKSSLYEKINYVECESHREVLLTILKKYK